MKAHGSLFSGIGGFDLAAEWIGWENLFHCEWNEFGQKVLNYYWPKAKCYGDITQTDFTIWRGRIDILTGGFPCQPYSQAGKRLGTEDARHLWPEMLRAIREIQPRYVMGENVSGLINWNGGVVFDEVQSDLEDEGYEVWPVILPACSVGAPHRRDRVWFVAYANERTTGPSRKSTGTTGKGSGNNDEPKERGKQAEQYFGHGNVYGINSDTRLQRTPERQKQTMGVDKLCTERNASDTKQPGLEGKDGEWMDGAIEFAECITSDTDSRRVSRPGYKLGESGKLRQGGQNFTELCYQYFTGMPGWDFFPTQPPICSGDDGVSPELAGITVSKHRKESLKAYGNAIVPQVAFQIFKAIEQCEKRNQ